MKKICLVMLFITTNVMGASLEFKFTVNSSGPSIYACDAGLKHAPHKEQVCYDRVTMDSCNPSRCTDEVQCNCVCTGESRSDAGEYRHDFLNASYAAWTENGERTTNISSASKAANTDSFNRVFTSNNEWNKQLTKLSFNLGSERYGAEFYLDICYRGPQIDYYAANSLADTPNFLLKAQATVTDVDTNNGMSYSSLSDLQVRAVTACDQQGKGAYVYAGNGDGSYDNALLNEITSDVTVAAGQFQYSTPFSGFNTGSNLFLIDRWINNGNTYTPRFCKVRYYFKENKRNSNDLISTIRKWKIQKAKVCTYTSVNEDI